MDHTFKALSALERAEYEFPGISKLAHTPNDAVQKGRFAVEILNKQTEEVFGRRGGVFPKTPFSNYVLLDRNCEVLARVPGYRIGTVEHGIKFLGLTWKADRWLWTGGKCVTVGETVASLEDPDQVRHIMRCRLRRTILVEKSLNTSLPAKYSPCIAYPLIRPSRKQRTSKTAQSRAVRKKTQGITPWVFL